MLNNFKNFTADRLDIDELVELAAFGRSLRAEYEARQIEEPEYVSVQLKTLGREITTRNAERLEARRREITSRLDSLKTPTEKKTELLRERKKIDEQLAAVS